MSHLCTDSMRLKGNEFHNKVLIVQLRGQGTAVSLDPLRCPGCKLGTVFFLLMCLNHLD